MTDVKMNATARKNLRLAAVAVGVAVLSGCGASFSDRSTPDSPLSSRIQGLVDAHQTYPRWADFPDAPTDAPDSAFIAGQVDGLTRTGQGVSRAAAAIDWTRADPETYAASVRRRVEGARMSVGVARTAAEVEAFARSLRERSEAPPPIDPRADQRR